MTDQAQPHIVQIVTMDSILYGIDAVGAVYSFNFGQDVFADSVATHEEMVDTGWERVPVNRCKSKHIGYKNRGWVKIENFVNKIPEGFTLRK